MAWYDNKNVFMLHIILIKGVIVVKLDYGWKIE